MGLTIRWTAFPLHPETPEQGRSLDDLFAGRGMDIPKILTRLKQTADSLGLPFTERAMTYNSRRAQELGKWAEAMDLGEAFHHETFNAYFAQGRNIAKVAVLRDISATVGLDPDLAETVLHEGRYKAAVDEDWRRCYQIGITAVPTFHVDGRFLAGAQTYEAIKHLVSG